MKVTIAGGGVAAVEAALALHDLAGAHVAVTIVSPRADFVLTPSAIGAVFGWGHVQHWPLSDIADEVGATVVAASIVDVRPDEHQVELSDGLSLDYDVLLLACGAEPRPAFDNCCTFLAEGDPAPLRGILADLEGGWSKSVAFVVPSSVHWTLPAYELALLTSRQVRSMGIGDTEITIVTHEDRPLSLLGPQANAAIVDVLAHFGVAVECGANVEAVIPGHGLRLGSGDRTVGVERVVALPRLEGHRLPGLPCDRDGFLPVDGYGRVGDVVDIFAAGDNIQSPLKHGGIATQQADVAARSIAALVVPGVEPRPLRHLHHGSPPLIGDPVATDEHSWRTAPPWWLPTDIVGRYLQPWVDARLTTPDRTATGVGAALKATGADLRPTADQIGGWSFPASDPPQSWTWEVV